MFKGWAVLAGIFLSMLATGLSAEIWSAPKAFGAVQRGELVLLDIRTPEEWSKSGVPEGAWPVNLYDPEFGRALQAVIKRNPAARVGMICAVGGRTGYVEQVLKKNGFPEIVNVGEGLFGSAHGKGWLKQGLPVVSAQEALAAMPADYRAK